jgi:UTP:GlnB (protein PII) uridylyltransferase
MTKTIQHSTWKTLYETGKDLTTQNPETEDNMRLLLHIFDSLNDLYERLNRLNYVLQRKNIEQILYHKGTGGML